MTITFLEVPNLLPQPVPRADIYTELINGGSFRLQLQSLKRVLFYIHGHTHFEAVEVISNPRRSKSKIICLGAMDLSKGFDILNLHFSGLKNELTGYEKELIGCTIERFRSDDNFLTCPKDADDLHIVIDQDLIELPNEYNKIMNGIQNKDDYIGINEVVGPGDSALKIAKKIEELYWRGFIDIKDFKFGPEFWGVRRIHG